jgi:hypothetical protein
MNNESNFSVLRTARIVGLGLLTVAFFTRGGTHSEVVYQSYVGLVFALWCLIEIIRTYSQRQS